MPPTVPGGRPSSGGEAPDAGGPLLLSPDDAGPLAKDLAALPPPSPPVASPRYEVLEELGQGGMGVVHRARDHVLGRDVALKVLRGASADNEEAVERFEREARAAALLEHPHIVRVFDVGRRPDGAPYYTMELVHGVDLATATQQASLSIAEAVQAVRQVAQALSYAHQQGVLHRDIKPRNVMILRRRDLAPSSAETMTTDSPVARGQVHALLLDFGLARLTEHELGAHSEGAKGRSSVQTLTQSGQLCGTPTYMAPEQVLRAHRVDARADVYALGATLYHALSGRPPFEAPSLVELLADVEEKDPSSPRMHNSDVDGDLCTIVLKCLQKDPKDRYQGAADLAEDCRRWLAGEPLLARPVGLAGRVWRRAKRNKAVAIPIAAAALVTLAVLGIWVGTAVWRRVQASHRMAEAEDLLAQGTEDAYRRALDKGLEARALAPKNDAVNSLLARICCAGGMYAARQYRDCRDRAAALEGAGETSKPPATPEELDAARRAREDRQGAMRDACLRRDEWWADAALRYHDALTHVEGFAEAKRALMDLHWELLLRAERAHDDAEAERQKKFIEEYGGDEGRRRVAGEKPVRVTFLLPESCKAGKLTVFLYRYEQLTEPCVLAPSPCDPSTGRPVCRAELGRWQRVLFPCPAEEAAAVRDGTAYALREMDGNRMALAVTSGARHAAMFQSAWPKGSYLLYLPAGQGVCPTRYPMEVGREFEWDESCELAAEEPPPLGRDRRGDDWVFLPAGPYRAGGDPEAEQWPPRPAMRVQAAEEDRGGVFLSRFKVTSEMYAAYLNDRSWHPVDRAFRRVPRQNDVATPESAYWRRNASGALEPGGDPGDWVSLPVFGISWNDAADYAAWLTHRSPGGRWRYTLPTEDEWERAARGVDGRAFPWGDSFDPTFCRMMDSRLGDARNQPEMFGLFPLDEGPFGVRDVAGVMAEWTLTGCDPMPGNRLIKGGGWGSTSKECRCARRIMCPPAVVNGQVGFRLAAHLLPR